jgi:adenylate kinase
MMGPPGSGKGTQSARIAEHFRVPHLSTGALFRDALEKNPESDIAKAAAVITNGGLVDDSVVMDVVASVLERYSYDVVLDGFPRTTHQADLFDRWLVSVGKQIDKVVFLHVPNDELIERLGARRTCKDCGYIASLRLEDADTGIPCPRCGQDLYRREDDRPTAISRRLAIYESLTAPLLAKYIESGQLASVDGTQSPDGVFHAICETLTNPI